MRTLLPHSTAALGCVEWEKNNNSVALLVNCYSERIPRRFCLTAVLDGAAGIYNRKQAPRGCYFAHEEYGVRECGGGVNDHPHSGWLYYAAKGREIRRNVSSHV